MGSFAEGQRKSGRLGAQYMEDGEFEYEEDEGDYSSENSEEGPEGE